MNFDFCWLEIGIGEPLFGGKVTGRRLLPRFDFEMLHCRKVSHVQEGMMEERSFNAICATAMRDTVRRRRDGDAGQLIKLAQPRSFSSASSII